MSSVVEAVANAHMLLDDDREVPMSRVRTIVFAASLGLLAAAPATAQFRFHDGPDIQYYYEEVRNGRVVWGWSDSPRPIDPRAEVTRPRTLREACARRVGRMLRTDTSALTQSFAMTEACVQNGGRG